MEDLKYLQKSTSPQKVLPSRSENLGSFCSVPPPASAKTLNQPLNTGGLFYKSGMFSLALGLPGLQGPINWIPKCFSSAYFLLFWDKDVSLLFFVCIFQFSHNFFYPISHIAWQPSKSPRWAAAEQPHRGTSEKGEVIMSPLPPCL